MEWGSWVRTVAQWPPYSTGMQRSGSGPLSSSWASLPPRAGNPASIDTDPSVRDSARFTSRGGVVPKRKRAAEQRRRAREEEQKAVALDVLAREQSDPVRRRAVEEEAAWADHEICKDGRHCPCGFGQCCYCGGY